MCLYICNINEFMNLGGLDLVTLGRRARVLRFRQPKDRARSLVSGLFLRRFCGVTDDSQLIYSENEKPALRDGKLRFNISHSGDYVVLATSEHEIGVDIEVVAPRHAAVAKRCFQGPELEWMDGEANEEAFFYLWTGKESVMKLLGTGFSLAPHTFSLMPIDSSPHHICGQTMYFDWRQHNGHIICRASVRPLGNAPMMTVNLLDLLKNL